MERPDRMNRVEPCLCIADRNPNVSVYLGRVFLERGYKTRVARNCLEVWRMFREPEAPDLLIFDLEIPCMDSVGTLARLMGRLPELPVVLYAHGSEGLDHPMIQGAAALVRKSPDTRALVRTVDHLINRAYPGRFAEFGLEEEQLH